MTQKWNEVVTLPPTDIASRFYVACSFCRWLSCFRVKERRDL